MNKATDVARVKKLEQTHQHRLTRVERSYAAFLKERNAFLAVDKELTRLERKIGNKKRRLAAQQELQALMTRLGGSK